MKIIKIIWTLVFFLVNSSFAISQIAGENFSSDETLFTEFVHGINYAEGGTSFTQFGNPKVLKILDLKIRESINKKFQTSVLNGEFFYNEFKYEFGEISKIPNRKLYRVYNENGILIRENWIEKKNLFLEYIHEENKITIVNQNKGQFDNSISDEILEVLFFDSENNLLFSESYKYEWDIGKRIPKIVNRINFLEQNSNEIIERHEKYVFVEDNFGVINKIYSIQKDSGEKNDLIILTWNNSSLDVSFPSKYFRSPTERKIFIFDKLGNIVSEKFQNRVSPSSEWKTLRETIKSYDNKGILINYKELIYSNKLKKLVPSKEIKITSM